MSYYPQLDNHMKDTMKVVLDVTDYASRKKQTMLQVLIDLNVDELGDSKLKTVPEDLQQIIKLLKPQGLTN